MLGLEGSKRKQLAEHFLSDSAGFRAKVFLETKGDLPCWLEEKEKGLLSAEGWV